MRRFLMVTLTVFSLLCGSEGLPAAILQTPAAPSACEVPDAPGRLPAEPATSAIPQLDEKKNPIDKLNPAVVRGHRRGHPGREWRKYYRLVYNFGKVYPYAKEAAVLLDRIDSTLAVTPMNSVKKERYLANEQQKLFKMYKKPLVSMTVTQGALLLKLIDRESSRVTYDIISDYRSRVAAGFWNGIARMFDMNLKKPYDPEGEDREVEELVQIWENGGYPDLYFSIFGSEYQAPVLRSSPSKTR